MSSEDLFSPVNDKGERYKKLLTSVLTKRFMVYVAGQKPTEQKMISQDYSNIMEFVEKEMQEEKNDN